MPRHPTHFALPSPEPRVPALQVRGPGSSPDPASRVPRPGGSPIVHVSYALPRRGLPAPVSFRCWVTAALAGARRRAAAELAIRIVGTSESRALNRRYRDRDRATNVLSFTAELAPGLRLPLLGDLVICAPVVAREAREQGKPPAAHYAHLTIHGVLHLLGHDHQLEAPARRMETLETRILAGLGIADPYADERGRRPFG